MHNNACSLQLGFRYRVVLNPALILQVGGAVNAKCN
jgi:hypothetical protein